MPVHRIPATSYAQQGNNSWAEGAEALGKMFQRDYKTEAEAQLLGQKMRTSASQAGYYDAQTGHTNQETADLQWKQGKREEIFAQVDGGLLDPKEAGMIMFQQGLLDGDAAMMNAIGPTARAFAGMQPGARPEDMTMPMLGAGDAFNSTPLGTREGEANAFAKDSMTAQREAAADTVPVVRNGAITLVPRAEAVAEGYTPVLEKTKMEGAQLAGAMTADGVAKPGFDTTSLEGQQWSAVFNYRDKLRSGQDLTPAEWDHFQASYAALDQSKVVYDDLGNGNMKARTERSDVSRAGFGEFVKMRGQPIQPQAGQPQVQQPGVDIFGEQAPVETVPATAPVQQQPQNIFGEANADEAAAAAAAVNDAPAPPPSSNPAGGFVTSDDAAAITTETLEGEGKDISGKQTEAQARFGQYAGRISPAMFNYADHMGYNLGTGKVVRNASGRETGYRPGFYSTVVDNLAPDMLRGKLSTEKMNLARTYMQQVLNPLMRADSGAAIPEGEYPRYIAQYIPVWGEDSEAEIGAKLDHLAVTLMAFEQVANSDYGKGIKEQAARLTASGNEEQAVALMNSMESRVAEAEARIMRDLPLNAGAGSQGNTMDVDGVEVTITPRSRR